MPVTTDNSAMVLRKEDRMALHRAKQADAERLRREFQWSDAR